MPRDSGGAVREAAGACRRPTSAEVECGPSVIGSAPGVLSATPPSVSSPFREPQSDGHAEMEGSFLVEPDLPREVVDELFDELVIIFVDELFQALDNLFLTLHVGGGEQLVF